MTAKIYCDGHLVTAWHIHAGRYRCSRCHRWLLLADVTTDAKKSAA